MRTHIFSWVNISNVVKKIRKLHYPESKGSLRRRRRVFSHDADDVELTQLLYLSAPHVRKVAF